MKLSAAARSDAGPRKTNQDAHFVDLDLGLLVVADGMGGHNAGEVASHMAIDAVVDFIRATKDSHQVTWPFPFDPTQSVAVNRVSVALRIANRKVHDAGARSAEHAGMGTTIVAALVDGQQIVIGHVGDSRAYCIRAGQLQQMTQDDTWLNAMLGAGAAEQAINHPMRHVLTSGIGMRVDVEPSLTEEALQCGEHWLICSDGVHGYLDNASLAKAVAAGSAEAAANGAVESALAAGTSDNATAVVLLVE
ncbi:MAG TPA: protein phosphatase 2C domain-containing protein [Vicinamibacterales bacterium]|nr:protein phosphatase 2C domain-containing protein [Vicinamibacterales bacterium]